MGDWVKQELERPEQPWLLRNMILPGGLTIIGGREKMGKSFHSMMMCMSMALGRPFGPFNPIGASSCLYLDLEGTARQTAERVRLMSLGMGFELSHLSLLRMATTRQFQLLAPGGATQLIKAVQTYGIGTVILDTFAASFEGDENSKKETQRYLNVAKEVRAVTGCAMMLVHHVNKASFGYKDVAIMMDPSAGLRGSSAIAAAYDVVISCQDGWVEDKFQRFMVSRGKYTEDWWCSYEIKGLKDADDQWLQSSLEYGKVRSELALIERGPSQGQPQFKPRPRGGE